MRPDSVHCLGYFTFDKARLYITTTHLQPTARDSLLLATDAKHLQLSGAKVASTR